MSWPARCALWVTRSTTGVVPRARTWALRSRASPMSCWEELRSRRASANLEGSAGLLRKGHAGADQTRRETPGIVQRSVTLTFHLVQEIGQVNRLDLGLFYEVLRSTSSDGASAPALRLPDLFSFPTKERV